MLCVCVWSLVVSGLGLLAVLFLVHFVTHVLLDFAPFLHKRRDVLLLQRQSAGDQRRLNTTTTFTQCLFYSQLVWGK